MAAAHAVAPIVDPLRLDSVILGDAATLRATVSDPDGNLVAATFLVSGPATRDMTHPGALGWPAAKSVGTVDITGSQACPQLAWRPPQIGSYTVWMRASDLSSTTTQAGAFETVTGRLVVPPTTIANGANKMFLYAGEIRTQENDTTPNVVVQSGGNLILWAGGRVVLKPGFRAFTGSSFWAAVDHNLNGYSDEEEEVDSDGDGMPDAWEVDQHLDPFNAADASLVDPATGLSHLQTYRSVRDNGDIDHNGLPDIWEMTWFGHIRVDPNADPDGDRASNLLEYRTGRDPTRGAVTDTTGAVDLEVYSPNR
jgi:hypothetical protein